MEFGKKKCSNFSKQEVEVLVAEVELRQDVLFGKFGVNLTADMKRIGWSEVTEKVNQVSGGEVRTEKSVRKKWTDMTSVLKKREAARRREMSMTGGGTATDTEASFTDVEVKVVGMLASEAIEGVNGGCDGIDVSLPSTSGGALKNESSSSDATVGVKVSGKQKDSGIEELARVEKRRLEIEEERLAVEKRRLEIEEKRLRLEEERWVFEQNRLTASCATVLFADE